MQFWINTFLLFDDVAPSLGEVTASRSDFEFPHERAVQMWEGVGTVAIGHSFRGNIRSNLNFTVQRTWLNLLLAGVHCADHGNLIPPLPSAALTGNNGAVGKVIITDPTLPGQQELRYILLNLKSVTIKQIGVQTMAKYSFVAGQWTKTPQAFPVQ